MIVNRESSDTNALAFENLKSTVLVISFLIIYLNITVIEVIVNLISLYFFFNIISAWRFSILILKVVPQGWIVIEIDGFELSIGVEAEDGAKEIIDKADDGYSIDELLHAGPCGKVCLVLDGCEEKHHVLNGEVDADEDVYHDQLVVQEALDHEQ